MMTAIVEKIVPDREKGAIVMPTATQQIGLDVVDFRKIENGDMIVITVETPPHRRAKKRPGDEAIPKKTVFRATVRPSLWGIGKLESWLTLDTEASDEDIVLHFRSKALAFYERRSALQRFFNPPASIWDPSNWVKRHVTFRIRRLPLHSLERVCLGNRLAVVPYIDGNRFGQPYVTEWPIIDITLIKQ